MTTTREEAERISETDDVAAALRYLVDSHSTNAAVDLVHAVMKAVVSDHNPSPPSELVKTAGDAILVLRCLSVDENLKENWRDTADRAANELSVALDKFK